MNECVTDDLNTTLALLLLEPGMQKGGCILSQDWDASVACLPIEPGHILPKLNLILAFVEVQGVGPSVGLWDELLVNLLAQRHQCILYTVASSAEYITTGEHQKRDLEKKARKASDILALTTGVLVLLLTAQLLRFQAASRIDRASACASFGMTAGKELADEHGCGDVGKWTGKQTCLLCSRRIFLRVEGDSMGSAIRHTREKNPGALMIKFLHKHQECARCIAEGPTSLLRPPSCSCA
jgi:hypothetical protein